MSENLGNERKIEPVKTVFYNCIKNEFDTFTEIVFYKKPFQVTTGNLLDIDVETGEALFKNIDVDRSRKFKYESGVLVPKDSETLIKIQNIQNSIHNSRSRALDSVFGYTLSNDWKYFITLTFDKNKIDREDDDEVKYAWKKFREKLQYIDEDVKIFAIPERHVKGSNTLHIHSLVGNIDLSGYIEIAKNPKGNYIRQNGKYVYNLKIFDYGFSTCVECDNNKLNLANYLTKYMIKDFGTIGYNKKSYFATRNCNFKNKEYYYLKDFDTSIISDMLSDTNFCKKYKETDNIIVYRYTLPFQN